MFGERFAEVPYLATKDGYRREGHARRLLGVRHRARARRRPCMSPPARQAGRQLFACASWKQSAI